MEFETAATNLPPPPANIPDRGLVHKVFLNFEGLRAGWRLLMYMALLIAFFLGKGLAVAILEVHTGNIFFR